MSRILGVLLVGVLLAACDGESDVDAAVDATVDAGADAGPAIDAGPPQPLPAPEPTTCPDVGARRVLFGDLHVHTTYSFDAIFFNYLNGPEEAYAFARGEAASLPCGDDFETPCREQRLTVPLDFVAVTDHAEYFGVGIGCAPPEGTRPHVICPGIGTYIRQNIGEIAFGADADPRLLDLVREVGDPVDAWERSVQAANDAYDPCEFTTFVAYEHSPQNDGAMLHRNILFRGTEMPWRAISADDAVDEWPLFRLLDELCPPGDDGVDCEYLSIPHNANLSDGRMFPATLMDGDVPVTQAQVERRAQAEVLLEIIQHKGQSECQGGYANPLSAEEDLACDFEQMSPVCRGLPEDPPNCVAECITPAIRGTEANPPDCSTSLDMGRNTLVEGLRLAERYEGVNPYQLGFVAATDTHNGIPGAVDERTFLGHGGILDDEPRERLGEWVCPDGAESCAPTVQEFDLGAFPLNPGGLTAVWAEQNTREAIFDALQRREAYATSGPRIEVRTYAGWSLPDGLCDRLATGAEGIEPEDVGGVPMGATLVDPPTDGAPTIAINAVADPLGGTPLQRIEIIKGWVDAAGEGHIEVVTVIGDETGPAPGPDCAIDVTAEPERLCGVYRDPDFDPAERAYYYARVLENPSCRWSGWECAEQGVDCSTLDPTTGRFSGDDEGYEGCCTITREGATFRGENRLDVIEERAWTSPVWYEGGR